MRILSVAAVVASVLSMVLPPAIAATPVVSINLGKTVGKVSPTLYGLMTEEINYSYDGGLYAELIRNRAFKDNAKEAAHWSAVQYNGGSASIALDRAGPVNEALNVSLKVEADKLTSGQRAGVANDGYWGIPIRPQSTYRASFYAKGSEKFQGPLTVAIESSDGTKVYAKAEVEQISSAWKQYTVKLTTGDAVPSSANRFVIATGTPGTFWLSLASLFPPTYNDRPNGNRIDIMQKLVDMKPTFLRFPGGNYVEGNNMENRFDWKKTIHKLEQRPGHRSPWSYRSTDGMGLLEFLEWTHDMHGEPVLAVFAGYTLDKKFVAPGPALKPFVDEALEEIEYVSGDASTTWGAQRAADGHPEPFKLTYVEIGNEDWFDKSGSYEGRFAQFYDAIKAKYPKIQLIATTRVKSRVADVIDEHFYMSAEVAEKKAHLYDKRDRKGMKVFVGEWATREGAPTTNHNAALADAAFMTGMERNSDIVILSCYAPLFVNVNPGGMQWKSDLIGYDALNSYGCPSYYVQKMFGNYLGDVLPESSITDVPLSPKGIEQVYYSVTRDSAKGTVYLKLVNVGGSSQPVQIEIRGAAKIAGDATSVVLSSAAAKDTNTIAEPTKIVPSTSKIGGIGPKFLQPLPAYSVTVLQIECR